MVSYDFDGDVLLVLGRNGNGSGHEHKLRTAATKLRWSSSDGLPR